MGGDALMPKPKLIIDGDIPLYAVAFSVEEPINWGNDFWTLHADMGRRATLFKYG